MLNFLLMSTTTGNALMWIRPSTVVVLINRKLRSAIDLFLEWPVRCLVTWENLLGAFTSKEQQLVPSTSQWLICLSPLSSLQAITVTTSKGQLLILPFTPALKAFTAPQGQRGAISTAVQWERLAQGKNWKLSKNVRAAHQENTVNSLDLLPPQV